MTYKSINHSIREAKQKQKNKKTCKFCKKPQEFKTPNEDETSSDESEQSDQINTPARHDSDDSYCSDAIENENTDNESDHNDEEKFPSRFTGINSFCCKQHKKKRIDFYSRLGINLKTLRDKLITKQKEIIENKKELLWQLDATYDTRQLAIKEALTDFKSARTNYLRGKHPKFYLKQISKNTPETSFWVNDKAINIFKVTKDHRLSHGVSEVPDKQGVTITPRAMNEFINKNYPNNTRNNSCVFIQSSAFAKLEKAVRLNGGRFNDTKVYNNRGKWFILVSYPYEINTVEKESSLLSIDPGQVIPLAGYRPDDGSCFDIGVDRMKTVESLKQKIKLLNKISKKSKSKKKRKNIKNKIGKIYYKIDCIVSDFHNQTASWIAKNHTQVLLPKLDTQRFQQGNLLKTSVKRKLNSISHYRLREKIKYLCHIYDTKLYAVSENHTSRTCPNCGHWNPKINDRVHICECCKFEGNRDHVGGCNILIRTATVYRREK